MRKIVGIVIAVAAFAANATEYGVELLAHTVHKSSTYNDSTPGLALRVDNWMVGGLCSSLSGLEGNRKCEKAGIVGYSFESRVDAYGLHSYGMLVAAIRGGKYVYPDKLDFMPAVIPFVTFGDDNTHLKLSLLSPYSVTKREEHAQQAWSCGIKIEGNTIAHVCQYREEKRTQKIRVGHDGAVSISLVHMF